MTDHSASELLLGRLSLPSLFLIDELLLRIEREATHASIGNPTAMKGGVKRCLLALCRLTLTTLLTPCYCYACRKRLEALVACFVNAQRRSLPDQKLHISSFTLRSSGHLDFFGS